MIRLYYKRKKKMGATELALEIRPISRTIAFLGFQVTQGYSGRIYLAIGTYQ